METTLDSGEPVTVPRPESAPRPVRRSTDRGRLALNAPAPVTASEPSLPDDTATLFSVVYFNH